MNIVLCGFMGCGKSTVGRLVAQRMQLEFVDMDSYIERQAGCTVSEIFARDGEAAFRALETRCAWELSARDGLVIATGGGAVMNPENVQALRSGGVLILLQISPETVLYRLRNNNTRPLLQRPDKEAAVRELMEQRRERYLAAASVVVDGNMPSSQVATQVCHIAKRYLKKTRKR